ncbi:MAG: PHP domain-containing protein [Actinobacteria bacterium]|nr:PHP domain-containing protein [Actinomycetota bacterium]
MPADYHIHSNYSDGTYTIDQIIEEAERKQLTSISLTDHDSVGGIKEIVEKSNRSGIKVVPGIELSSVYKDEDVHILGYGIDFKNEELLSSLELFKKKRIERLIEIVDCLKEFGYEIEVEDLLEIAGSSEAVGRSHIARVLVNKGYINSVSEAFNVWLSRNKPCFREKFIVTPFEQINLVIKSSGIPVLAHPGDYRVSLPIEDLVDAGLKGIEVFHPDHTEDQIIEFLELAKRYGLLILGGSDAHGPDSERGYSIGQIKLPDEYERVFLEAVGI